MTPPALMITIGVLVLLPLFNTKVPPARTGLYVVPKLLVVTVAPVVMFDGVVVVVVVAVVLLLLPPLLAPLLPPLLPPLLIQTLQAVRVKSQLREIPMVGVNEYE
jgi:hypothetical protein